MRPTGPRSWVALLFFCLALAVPFHEIWRAGLANVVPIHPLATDAENDNRFPTWAFLEKADAQWSAFSVSRQARVLATSPLELWDLESCHPAVRPIRLGEPVIALGLLGAPLSLVVTDPLVLFNLTLMAMYIASALAMFLLVSQWTGSRWAGMVAGLLYAFLPIKIYTPNHPYMHDTLWTVLALYFAREYFLHGRLRSIVLAAITAGVQMGASFYAFLSAVLLGLPFIAWLFISHGTSKLKKLHLLLALGIVMLALVVVFAPYLMAPEPRSTRVGSSVRLFADWRTFTPLGRVFPGYLVLCLVLLGVVIRRGRVMLSPYDPRPVLVLGGLLCWLLAMGPNSPVGNVYDLLARVVPGLGMVRIPWTLITGMHLAMCILAGFGAAGLLRWLPAGRVVVAGTGLILITFVTTFMLGFNHGPAPIVYQPYTARPAQAALDFYQELEEHGPEGALLDQPVSYRSTIHSGYSPLMLAAYHRRETSSCYGSYISAEHVEIVVHSQRLDEDDSVDLLIDFGFRTLVVRNWNTHAGVRDYARKLESQSALPGARLRIVLERPPLLAYELLDRVDRQRPTSALR